MAGIAEVARAAGVSKSTASRALTGSGYVSAATRARVRDAAAALGYVPTTSAVSLVTGRTQTVGVVMPSLDRWFFAQVLEGIQDALLERRFDLALYGAPPDSAARREMFEHFLARKRFDGLIAVGIEPSARELERLVAFGKPVVAVGGYEVGTNAVSIDDEAAARIATEHLIGLGHREIVFLGGDPDGRRTSFGDGRRLRRLPRRHARRRARGIRPSCPLRGHHAGRLPRRRSSCWATAARAPRRSSACATRRRSARSSRRGGSASAFPSD